MMNETFIQKIVDLAEIQEFTIDGRTLTSSQLFPVRAPEVDCIGCHTLTGLVDFYGTIPADQQPRLLFHIDDFNKVSIISEVFGMEKQRETFITATAYSQESLFNRYYDHEDFMIKILSCFVPDENTAKILRIVGNLKSEAGATYSDDGLTQTVTAKTGITKVENVDLPSPITLRPYRTFADIEQPESKFILRLKQSGGGISVALFEADGAAWKNTAIYQIKNFLMNAIDGARIIA